MTTRSSFLEYASNRLHCVVLCDGGCAPTRTTSAIFRVEGDGLLTLESKLPEGWTDIVAELTPLLERRGWTQAAVRRRRRLQLCPECSRS